MELHIFHAMSYINVFKVISVRSLPTHPEHLSSPSVLCGVHVAQSLVFSRVATKLQSAYVLAKGGWAYVSLSSLMR